MSPRELVYTDWDYVAELATAPSCPVSSRLSDAVESEPNDTIGDAVSVHGTDVLGLMSSDTDEDIYRFDVESARTVIVELTQLAVDDDLELLEADAVTAIDRSANAGMDSERVERTLDAGRYAVGVHSKSTGSTSQAYRLSIVR